MIKIFAEGAKYAEQANALAEKLPKNLNAAIGIGAENAKKVLAEKHKGAITINILDPQKNHDEFDFIFMAAHEPLHLGKNIYPVIGLLNKIKKLPDGDGSVAVLVGGKHIGGNFTENDAENLAALINKINAKIYITTSQRTELAASKKLRALAKHDAFYDFNYDAHIKNPYEEILARASAIIVTADSARMVSEACSSGKSVYIFTPEQTHFSYLALRDLLVKEGYANAEFSFTKTKLLNEAERAAQIVINQFCANSGL